MSPTATARQTSSALVEVLAVCQGCVWTSSAANALGNAAKHHDATGHAVETTLTRLVTYGDPSAPIDGQVVLDDVGDPANAA